MAIITPDLLKGLNTGFSKIYEDALKAAPTAWQEVASKVISKTESNTYGWLGDWPELREWIGDRQMRDMAAHGYQIINKKWESTVPVPRTVIEDDTVGTYAMRFARLGQAAAEFPDKLVFGLLSRGHSEKCHDGKHFFDTKHPRYPKVDGTGTPEDVSNSYGTGTGTAWYLLDTSSLLKPLIYQERLAPEFTYMTNPDDEKVFMSDEYRYGIRVRANVGFGFWQMAARSVKALNKANFEEVYDGMRGLKADGGSPLGIRPNLLVVPTNLRSKAKEVVGVQRLADGSDNPNFELVKVLDCAWLN